MAIDETQFHALADKILEGLLSALDDHLGDVLDVDVAQGVLAIGLDGKGQYVISKNAAVCELWLSSPVSGAWHFSWDGDAAQWRSTRGDGRCLRDLLADELAGLTGRNNFR